MMMGGGDGGSGNTNQFIGSKISLISKSEIRYEGILYSLDLEDATISLQKVRSFGTEDRPTPRPVGPKDEVYEFIIFRGADIKGIDVLEPPPNKNNPPPVEEEQIMDPAIVEVQHYQPAQAQQQQVPVQQGPSNPGVIGPIPQQGLQPLPQQIIDPMRNNFYNPPIPQQQPNFNIGVGFQQSNSNSSPPGQMRDQDDVEKGQVSNRGNASNRRGGYMPRGRGGGQMHSPQQQQQQQRGGQHQNNGRGGGMRGNYNNYYRYNNTRPNYFRRGELKGNKKLSFDEEFNFEKANEELQEALMKIKIVDEAKIEDKEESFEEEHEDNNLNKENDNKNFYSKDNFFDNISCEALERKTGRREKPDWRAERKLNAETFGLPMNKPRGGGGSSTYYRGGGYYNNYRGGGNYYRGGGDRGSYGRGGGGGFSRGGGAPSRGGARNNDQPRRENKIM